MSVPPAIVFTDWDGTVTLQDSNDYLTENLGFGYPKRKAINDEILDGSKSFRDGFQEMLDSIKQPFPECIDYLLKHVQLDPGFRKCYDYCVSKKIPIIIISSGMKPIIYNLLKHLVGEDAAENIEIYSNEVEYFEKANDLGKTWDIVYKDDSDFGHNKSLSIKEYLVSKNLDKTNFEAHYKDSKYPTLFYCGDGVSDLSAAKETDLLFAKHGKDLIIYCNRENIPYTEFNNFDDILSKLTKIMDGEGIEKFIENK
ncbi:polyol phosphate phosphatase Pyp1p [[Candida] jaroonii]|uniref:Polyol phosphate phosphatase Pyp1p n=1 Tax=[Candida] jaroonii TaxID=467808 RepID=A0ACA9Y7G7_9ASCO|nr:polyol phosphate phosphatase Pyp1p [[Candida] jaroonii]